MLLHTADGFKVVQTPVKVVFQNRILNTQSNHIWQIFIITIRQINIIYSIHLLTTEKNLTLVFWAV